MKLETPFYAPNFEEVEGAYWFGPVRLSVRLSVCNTLTLKEPITTAEDDIHKYCFIVFQRK